MPKKDWKATIPEKFWRGKHPRARTVGHLIDLLGELPSSMNVETLFGDPPEVVVFNISDPNPHVEIIEGLGQ